MADGVLIYGLADSADGRIRYVGQTVQAEVRMVTHLREARKMNGLPLYKWMRRCKKVVLVPMLVAELGEADRYEEALVRRVAGLVNVAEGGHLRGARKNRPMVRIIRWRCKQGHPLWGENLNVSWNKRRGAFARRCKECNRVRRKASRDASKVPVFYIRSWYCKKGHPLFGSNLVIRVRADGYVYRRCLECTRAWGRATRGRVTRIKKPYVRALSVCWINKWWCKHGHPLWGENLKIYRSGDRRIQRFCVQCNRERNARRCR